MTNNKVVKNASWIIVCRIVQAVLSFLISLFTARYLGPSNYGLISYAASLVAFVGPISSLGLGNIQVQELIQHPEEEGKILGTSAVMSICSALACMVGIASFTMVMHAGEWETILVCVLYSILLIFQVLEITRYWFQAKYMSKYTALISLCAYAVVSGYKVFLLVTGKNIYWFAVSNALDYMLIAIALYACYRKLGGRKLVYSASVARRMFSRSKYYIVSGLMVTLFTQTDRIMLKEMIDEAATGYYASAVMCAGMTNFVFMAIIDSSRPAILESAKVSREAFESSLAKLYSLVAYASLLQSIAITVLANPIISILYGEEYIPAVTVLRIIVWYTAFSYFGSAKDIWILVEGKQRYLVWLNMAGAIGNIALNAVLIPLFGAAGAAGASLVTQMITNVIMGIIIKPLRRNMLILLKATNPMLIISMIRDLKKKA